MPSEDDYGPCMAALNAKQRLFVEEYFRPQRPQGRLSRAYQKAYGGENLEAIAASASRLAHNPAVQAAIQEFARKAMISLAPEALDVLKEIMDSPTHKDRFKAAKHLTEAAAPSVQKIDVAHTHELVSPADRDREMLAYLRKLRELGTPREGLIKEFGYSGLGRFERLLALEDQSKIQDVEFTEVAPGSEGLEDLL